MQAEIGARQCAAAARCGHYCKDKAIRYPKNGDGTVCSKSQAANLTRLCAPLTSTLRRGPQKTTRDNALTYSAVGSLRQCMYCKASRIPSSHKSNHHTSHSAFSFYFYFPNANQCAWPATHDMSVRMRGAYTVGYSTPLTVTTAVASEGLSSTRSPIPLVSLASPELPTSVSAKIANSV